MRSTIIKFLPLSKNDLERKFGAQQMWQKHFIKEIGY